MYTPSHIKPYELVPQEFYEHLTQVYKKTPNKLNLIFSMFNPTLLWTADHLRKRYGLITINNWYYGGSLKYRGWRPMDCSVGAMLSTHKMGTGLDADFKDATAEEIRQDLIKHGAQKAGFRSNFGESAECFKHITRVEHTLKGKAISWFHFETGNIYNPDGSVIFLHL